MNLWDEAHARSEERNLEREGGAVVVSFWDKARCPFDARPTVATDIHDLSYQVASYH
jgi:hypothetical protein